MEKEIIKRIEITQSSMDLYRFREDIFEALGNSALCKKLKEIRSAMDFYALKEDMVKELSGKVKPKEGEDG